MIVLKTEICTELIYVSWKLHTIEQQIKMQKQLTMVGSDTTHTP